MNIVFTILAYRPSWTDSVMGCVQDQGDSEFEFEVHYDLKDAAESIARYRSAPPYNKYVINEWELTILFNGEEAQFFIENDEYNIIPEHQNTVINLEKQVQIELDKINRNREEAKRKKKEQERIQAEEIRKAKQEKRDKEDFDLFMKLKEKFKDETT